MTTRTLWVGALLALIGCALIAALLLNPFPPSGYGERREDEVFRDCSECPEMLPLPPGSFRMGEESGRRRAVLVMLGLLRSSRRHVTIAYSFAVSRHEVTFDQWDACVVDGGCAGYTPNDEGWGRGARPVIHVSWNDAQAYVRWLSEKTGERYRLLSEAEWEYAARAGTGAAYSWGQRASHHWANYGAPDCPPCTGAVEGRDQWLNTAPAGQFPPNRFGLFDMHGNVYEWVEDCNAYDPQPPNDGSALLAGACETRVIRGGAWYSNPLRIRADYHAHNRRDRRDWVIGFRVARTL